jgi:signal peptidase I
MSLSTILVKRCIGLPGESVSAIGGFYHVAGITDTLGYIPEQKRQLSSRSTLDSVLVRAFAFDESFHWDIFDFGPFYIPAKGSNIGLTPANFKLYHKLIAYETNAAVRMEDSLVYINDIPRYDYTVLNNWYFVAGDKVINSQDSRYIGLIPEAFIIGRASMVITSKDKNTGKRRWNRTFARIR